MPRLDRHACRWFAAMVVTSVIVVFAPAQALAQAPVAQAPVAQARVLLDWAVPDSAACIARSRLVEAVEARLRRPVFAAESEAGFVLRFEVTAEEGALVAHLELRDADGQTLGIRELNTEGECASFTDSLPLVVSLLVEQNQRAIVLYEPPVVEPLPTEPSQTTPAQSVDTPASFHFSYSVGASLRALDVPWPTFGLLQLVRFGWEALPLDFILEAGLLLPQVVTGEEGTADLWAWNAGAGLCPRFAEASWVEAITCASLLIGRQYATGRSFDFNRAAEAMNVLLVLRGGAQFRLVGPLEVGIALRAEAALLRADLVVGAAGSERTLFAGEPIGLGAEVWFSLNWGPS